MSEQIARPSATATRLALLATLSLPFFACSSAAPSEPTESRPQALAASDAGPALAWIGATSLAYALPEAPVGSPPYEITIPASFVVAGNDLTVSTQTYPGGAATAVTLYWANADYTAVASAPMALTASNAGSYGDNDSFRAVLPGSALAGGEVTHYWVVAQDAAGDVLYDSNGGANYAFTPRGLSIGWAGNLGAYDAQGGPDYYRVGALFNADLSTTVGCVENGYDDYQIQAAQVYVPGLTDQGYTGDLATAVTAILQAQLWTNLQPTGLGPDPDDLPPGQRKQLRLRHPAHGVPRARKLPAERQRPRGKLPIQSPLLDRRRSDLVLGRLRRR